MPNKTAIRSTYPWSQAVRNGLLIDVTETARGIGFNYPVAVTRTVWCRCVQAAQGTEGPNDARWLAYLLDTLFESIHALAGPGAPFHYQVRMRDDSREPKPVTLKAVLAFDDDGWPCLRVLGHIETAGGLLKAAPFAGWPRWLRPPCVPAHSSF